jgi:hypothetical protein
LDSLDKKGQNPIVARWPGFEVPFTVGTVVGFTDHVECAEVVADDGSPIWRRALKRDHPPSTSDVTPATDDAVG